MPLSDDSLLTPLNGLVRHLRNDLDNGRYLARVELGRGWTSWCRGRGRTVPGRLLVPAGLPGCFGFGIDQYPTILTEAFMYQPCRTLVRDILMLTLVGRRPQWYWLALGCIHRAAIKTHLALN